MPYLTPVAFHSTPQLPPATNGKGVNTGVTWRVKSQALPGSETDHSDVTGQLDHPGVHHCSPERPTYLEQTMRLIKLMIFDRERVEYRILSLHAWHVTGPFRDETFKQMIIYPIHHCYWAIRLLAFNIGWFLWFPQCFNFWLTFLMHLWSRFSYNGRTRNFRYDMLWYDTSGVLYEFTSIGSSATEPTALPRFKL